MGKVSVENLPNIRENLNRLPWKKIHVPILMNLSFAVVRNLQRSGILLVFLNAVGGIA
jgi:hypothetical protein